MSNSHLYMAKATVLVIDDSPENLRLLAGLLSEQGYEVRAAYEGEVGLESALTTPPDLILLDIRMPVMDGYEVCQRLKSNERARDVPVIFISALQDAVDKVKGFEVGGVDFITKPFEPEEVLARVKNHLILHRLRNHFEDLLEERTAELQREIAEHKQTEQELQQALAEIFELKARLQAENTYLQQEIKQEYDFDEIISQGEYLHPVLFKVEQVASTNTTVLISGETGTGKELFARAIHHASPRNTHPFIKVNCAALPSELIESELFGHEKGAFTGATNKQTGRFELAHNSTIFLDEIGELPPELQPKLLRVLQEGEFERLGNPRSIKVDVRIIAATNRHLEQEVQAGHFREDLYYRLSVYPISIPPLRERKEDIPSLVQYCMHKLSKKVGKQVDTISERTMQLLQEYPWPGNVRELENVIERAIIMAQDNILRVELPEPPVKPVNSAKTLEEVEREHIIRVLEEKDWRLEGPNGAAVVLDINPGTLRSRMKKLGIRRPKFKK